MGTGAIAGLFEQTADGYPVLAYRLIFLFLAVGLSAGIAVYSTVSDLKPRPAAG